MKSTTEENIHISNTIIQQLGDNATREEVQQAISKLADGVQKAQVAYLVKGHYGYKKKRVNKPKLKVKKPLSENKRDIILSALFERGKTDPISAKAFLDATKDEVKTEEIDDKLLTDSKETVKQLLTDWSNDKLCDTCKVHAQELITSILACG